MLIGDESKGWLIPCLVFGWLQKCYKDLVLWYLHHQHRTVYFYLFTTSKMSLIPTSYGDLIGNAAKQYLNYVPASALFSNDSGVPGLLIESVELLKEFVSKGVEFGKGQL